MLNFRRLPAPRPVAEKKTARFGREGEEAAARHLRGLGWRILDRNWRGGPLELDLVCREGDTLVFVEVKYRSTNESGLPEEAVDLRKQRQISRVAAWYLTEKGLDIYIPCRFDVVAIEGEEMRLYRDAFLYQG